MSTIKSNNVNLSEPWYTLRNQVAYTIGQTPSVVVEELVPGTTEGEYILKIRVSSCLTQAEAIRLIIPQTYQFGNISVITEVYLKNEIVTMPNLAITTPAQVATILSNALWCNPLVVGTLLTDGVVPPIEQGTIGRVVLVIKPCVIMFYNDDISDLCSNYLEVASKVFGEVMKLSYGSEPIKISVTTYDAKCIPCNLICPVCR